VDDKLANPPQDFNNYLSFVGHCGDVEAQLVAIEVLPGCVEAHHGVKEI
jgi:hypothetical protein